MVEVSSALLIVRCPTYLPYTTWVGVRTTLGEWWNEGRAVEVLQPVAGFSGRTVCAGRGTLAIQHGRGWSRASALRRADGSGFRLKFQPKPYEPVAKMDVGNDFPCLSLQLTGASVHNTDIILNA